MDAIGAFTYHVSTLMPGALPSTRMCHEGTISACNVHQGSVRVHSMFVMFLEMDVQASRKHQDGSSL